MNKKIETSKMTNFTSALQLLAGDRKNEYRSKLNKQTLEHDNSNYYRIYRWINRTSQILKAYLIDNGLSQSATEENFDLFMHYLLAIYFQSLENPNANKTFKNFKKDFPNFICNFLQIHKQVNRKGHLSDRSISRADMSLFFSLFLRVSKDIYDKTYTLTDTQCEKILAVKAEKRISVEDKIFRFMSIFFS